MQKTSICLKVPKCLGEKTLNLANKLGLTEKSLQIQKDKDYLYIPLNREPTEKENVDLKQQLLESQVSRRVFHEKNRYEKTLYETLANALPPNLLASLPRALDVVGDTITIEIPPELEDYKKTVGEAILETHRNVHVVLAKAGKIDGTFRLREFEFIAGEKRTATVHKEYGCSYYVDLAKAYFSPRLSQEHQRVASLSQEGETVVDLFAGVGPFSVPIAKKCKNTKVYAIDINADAIELLKKNVRLNRVESRVYPILGDARQIVYENFEGAADRVIMNLPETSSEFVDVACKAVKPIGGFVHFYGFMRTPQSIEDMKEKFIQEVKKEGRIVEKFTYANAVRETAPYEYQIVLDAKIR